jgi:hypothetical protein
LRTTVRGFAQRGFQGSNVSKVTQTSKQLDDFLKPKTPRCAKPLLAAVLFNFKYLYLHDYYSKRIIFSTLPFS